MFGAWPSNTLLTLTYSCQCVIMQFISPYNIKSLSANSEVYQYTIRKYPLNSNTVKYNTLFSIYNRQPLVSIP